MTLPSIAKRIALTAYRPGEVLDPEELDEQANPKRGDPIAVASWTGDIQPQASRAALDRATNDPESSGPFSGKYLILAEATPEMLTGYWVVRDDDPEGTRWNVDEANRFGEGMSLDHFELICSAVVPPVPVA